MSVRLPKAKMRNEYDDILEKENNEVDMLVEKINGVE